MPLSSQRAFQRFKDLADKKKAIYNEDLEAIVADSVIVSDDRFVLGDICIVSGSFGVPNATVELTVDGTPRKATGSCSGGTLRRPLRNRPRRRGALLLDGAARTRAGAARGWRARPRTPS